MFFSPSARIPDAETDQAIAKSDLRSVAECALAVHNAQILGGSFDDVCVSQNEITSKSVCLDSKLSVTACDAATSGRRKTSNFIVTTTGAIDVSDYNNMMEILEKNFANSGTFGVYQNGFIMSGGTSTKRNVPESIKREFNLQDGQLVYMTHYDTPPAERVFSEPGAEDVRCPTGTTKTYRFGRWQCIGYNMKTSCGGDMVWDYGTMECVPDESRKPLCAGNQTAIMMEDIWECVSPFPDKHCPGTMIARLNYDTLEWECVEDANVTKTVSKCAGVTKRAVRGRGGATLRIASTSCTDCEKAVLNEETCETTCLPDVDKLSSPSCYPGRAAECGGSKHAFYFGFPNAEYAAKVPDVSASDIQFDAAHSQNRKFNCLECENGIDTERSKSPYIAVCKE